MEYRPHLLPPSELFLAHLTPYLCETRTRLDAQLEATQAANEELVRQIMAQRREMEGLVEGLEGVVADLEGAGEAMEGVLGSGELQGEVREVEAELGAGVGREAKL